MAALQKLPCTTTSNTTAVQNVFPAGLRVLVVDNDVKTLRSLETMLWRCMYRVTTCSQATVALELLREKRRHFDVVLSDIHMPDMDGFKLLELVGLEMDLPVIMMSDDERTSLVLRGIKHGACDYLIKPIREEELRKIWQHVVRKRLNGNKEHEHSGSFDYNDWHKQAIDDTEYASSVNEGMLKSQKKRRDVKEEVDDELENDDQTASKRPRVVWSVELHQQFVSAVNQLGIDKAVPKRILELMNMPGLTRENVASHLQKFRLYLKRVSGSVTQQQGGIPNSFSGHLEQSWNVIAASGPQTLASMHAELLGEPTKMNQQQTLLQGQLLGSKCIAMDHGVAPMMRCQPKKNPQPIIAIDGDHSGFGSWPASSNIGAQNGSMLMGTLQKQQQQQHRKQHILSEPINVHPACLVVPSQSSAIFHSPASVNQPNGFNSNYSFGADGNLKLTGVFSSYSSISPSISLCSVDVENVVDQQVQKSIPTFVAGAFIPNMTDMQSSYNGQMIDEGMLRNLGFVGKGTSIPSCFALYEPESATGNLNQVKYYGGDSERKLKQELSVDLIDNLEWET